MTLRYLVLSALVCAWAGAAHAQRTAAERVPAPARMLFPLSDGILLGTGFSGRALAADPSAEAGGYAAFDFAHFGDLGRIGLRVDFSDVYAGLAATVAGRIHTFPIDGQIAIAIFGGGYLEVVPFGFGFGSESFALVRLLDWAYVEARFGLGALLSSGVKADPMPGRTNGGGWFFAGTFGLSIGFLLGGPFTPGAEPASALPPGESLEGDGT